MVIQAQALSILREKLGQDISPYFDVDNSIVWWAVQLPAYFRNKRAGYDYTADSYQKIREMNELEAQDILEVRLLGRERGKALVRVKDTQKLMAMGGGCSRLNQKQLSDLISSSRERTLERAQAVVWAR